MSKDKVDHTPQLDTPGASNLIGEEEAVFGAFALSHESISPSSEYVQEHAIWHDLQYEPYTLSFLPPYTNSQSTVCEGDLLDLRHDYYSQPFLAPQVPTELERIVLVVSEWEHCYLRMLVRAF